MTIKLTYQDAFDNFREQTNEKSLIRDIIASQIKFNSHVSVLDIGGYDGAISKQLQPNYKKITIVDIADKIDLEITRVHGRFEETSDDELKSIYDVVIATHVWGHFYKNDCSTDVLMRSLNLAKDYLVIGYNLNTGFMGELINLVPDLAPESKFELFDYNLIRDMIVSSKTFHVDICANSFEDLANLTRILFANTNEEYNSNFNVIQTFYETNLHTPCFPLEQKLLFIK